ncbi:tail fiber protein [Shigella phage vB_SflM_004]|nr:tail fiber protein [Shigella phage vB_SflM_004]
MSINLFILSNNFCLRFLIAADQRFARLTENNTFSGANNFTNYQTIISDGSLLRLKPATANGAVFVQAYAGSGSESWYLGQPDGTKQDVNLFNQMTGATMRLYSSGVSFEAPFIIAAWVLPRWLISPPI